jgi:hypothetical protein
MSRADFLHELLVFSDPYLFTLYVVLVLSIVGNLRYVRVLKLHL